MTGPAAILRVDLSSPVPVYRQIADAIRALLVQGRFREGDQLPPARELATDLAVNHNTVVQGYRILAEEGWIALGRRRGATVQARPSRPASEEAAAQFRQRVTELVAQGIAQGLSRETISRALDEARPQQEAKR